MAILTPNTGFKIIAISLYLPQHNTTQGKETYKEALLRLSKTLTEDLPHVEVLLGGYLQATPSAGHPSHSHTLDHFCTSTGLKSIGDPYTPTFIPMNSSLDHWLLRLPANTCATTYDHAYTTPRDTTYSVHSALTADIPQVGNPTAQTKYNTTNIPTTRTPPSPFTLPIPKSLIDFYHPGDDATKQALEEAQNLLASLHISTEPTTTDNNDHAAKIVIHTLTR